MSNFLRIKPSKDGVYRLSAGLYYRIRGGYEAAEAFKVVKAK